MTTYRPRDPVLTEVRFSDGTEFEQAWYVQPPSWGVSYTVTDEEWDDGPPPRRSIYAWEPR